MNVDIFSALLTAAATVFVAFVGIIPALLKAKADRNAHQKRMENLLDAHIAGDTENFQRIENSLERLGEKTDEQRLDFLRQAIFNRGLPIAERCRLGAAYIERGGNGEAAIEHEINLELLEKKKRKESAEALAAGRVNL